MNDACKIQIQQILACEYRAVMVVAGGGVGAVDAILRTPGASRFVLDVRVPYSREVMNEYLGYGPDSYCSADTALKMAQVALSQASRFTDRPLGAACTAALKTNEDRADADRAFICICSADANLAFELQLEPGSRNEQEQSVSGELLSRLAEFVEKQGV